MILEIFKFPYDAFTKGEICGFKVTRNPLMWIPFFVMAPICLIGYLLFMVFVYPFLMVWMIIGHWRFFRKTITFDEHGITYDKAYGQRKIPWDEIKNIEWKGIPMPYYMIWIHGAKKPLIAVDIDCEASDFEQAIREAGVSYNHGVRQAWIDQLDEMHGSNGVH